MSNREDKQKERRKKRANGWVPMEIWIIPDDKGKFKALAAKSRAKVLGK